MFTAGKCGRQAVVRFVNRLLTFHRNVVRLGGSRASPWLVVGPTVIVNVPPAVWPAGVLVVRIGATAYVRGTREFQCRYCRRRRRRTSFGVVERLVEADDQQTEYEADDLFVKTIEVGGVFVAENLSHCRQERLLYRLLQKK